MKPIYEWFDPKNPDHIKAYKHLQKTAMWPEGFIPDDVEVTINWQFSVTAKIAQAYLDQFEVK